MAAHLGHLEPVEVADRLPGDIDRLVDGVLDALVRGSDHFAQRVNVVHGDSPGPALLEAPQTLNAPPAARFLCRRRTWRQWGQQRHIAAIFSDRRRIRLLWSGHEDPGS